MTTPTAIVTGASRGIGRAIATQLDAAGYHVVVNYNSNEQAAQDAAAAVEAAARAEGRAVRTALVQADVGDLAQHPRILDAAIALGGDVHLLVNNAGIAPKVRADLMELTPDNFDAALHTNLRGPFFLSQLVARHMIQEKVSFQEKVSGTFSAASSPSPSAGGPGSGSPFRAIVNVSSISAFTASVNRGEYCVAKAGVAMATKLFAARLAEHGINVYEVRPGVIETDMTSSPAVKAKYDKLILEQGLTPIARWGRPDDVAAAVRAIAEARLPFSTGEALHVDGGFHLHRL